MKPGEEPLVSHATGAQQRVFPGKLPTAAGNPCRRYSCRRALRKAQLPTLTATILLLIFPMALR